MSLAGAEDRETVTISIGDQYEFEAPVWFLERIEHLSYSLDASSEELLRKCTAYGLRNYEDVFSDQYD